MDIRLLGAVQLVTADSVVEVGPPQRCLVLAALAVAAGKPVATEVLLSRVWGDDRPEQARRTLHVHISVLRGLLARHSGDAVAIVSRAGGYVLDLDADHVDLFRLRRIVQQARTDAGRRLALLREAVGMWRGEPLAGLRSAWAVGVRRTLRHEHKETVIAWSVAELSAGNAVAVVEPLTDLAGTDLSDQRLVATLMRALHAVGDTQEALALYQSAYERIVRDDGLTVGPELTRVQLGILRGDMDSGTSIPTAHRSNSPVQVGTIPPRADSFQERAIAKALSQAATPGRTTVLTQVVAGLGGVGKTQLAAEFARRLLDGGDADLVLWISAVSRDSVVSGYVQAGTDLELGPGDEEPERTAGRLLAWLATTSRRWLVVLDDLAGPADIRDLWPPDRPTGRTVVTTRRRDADLLAGRVLMEVNVFTEAEAVGYVTRKLKSRPHLADDVRGVVADLDALPLALGHAAAYMIDLELPCSAYRVRFADRRRGLAELFPHPDTLYEGNSRTVATTWTLSIDAADQLPPAGIARPLLAIISALNPNGIPEAVLTAPSAEAYLAAQCGRMPSHTDIRDGLRGLHRFHLVTHENGVIRIHALVQRAVRESLSEVQSTAVARASADAILEIWPTIDTLDGQLLRANAMALQHNWSAAIWDPQRGIHPVMTRTMTSLGAAVQLDEAIRLCKQLNRHALEYIGPQHPDTLALRNQLATWLGDAGHTQEAVVALSELVPDIISALGRDHPTAITARCNLGYQWGQAGYPEKAVTVLTEALADQERVLGPGTLPVLHTRHQIVYWRSKTENTAKLVGQLEELLRLTTPILGPEHREIFELRGTLASFRAEIVGHAQSAAEMREVLDDMRRALGPTHRDVSVLRLNLADRQRLAGDLTTALAGLQELLTERIRSHGPYHRDTIATHHCLSHVLTDLGDYPQAATELAEVVEGMRRMVGPLHQDTLRRRYELGLLWARTGEHRAAADLLVEVLAAQRNVLGDAHPDVAATREALTQL
ncbi:BTAD domain-containing putative transcriptional regulator [Saccharothrix sp. BKS2]|uniref:tetratricopeptide repeat protein n=1 Tax=Saccharothrix sp. BKS2 TaxID=3064400 RepID=UPI0039E976BE